MTDPRKQRFIVKVHNLLAEGKDRENPIPVNDLGDHAHGRAVVFPNKKCVLSQCQINILKDCVEHMEVQIPEDSGIYQETDPIAAAEKHYPGFSARRDKMSGTLIVTKSRPRFSVEVIEPVKVKTKAEPAKAEPAKAELAKAEPNTTK